MPSIDKLIPRYLNTDDDERLVKNVEMTDAQNLRVSVDVERDALVFASMTPDLVCEVERRIRVV